LDTKGSNFGAFKFKENTKQCRSNVEGTPEDLLSLEVKSDYFVRGKFITWIRKCPVKASWQRFSYSIPLWKHLKVFI